ncbi:MAG: hypothetical protein J7K40_08310 [candidate division Zixibacteria bacterium]|nr:hypothetical protein [candidate division Zixibacteria bacterium]
MYSIDNKQVTKTIALVSGVQIPAPLLITLKTFSDFRDFFVPVWQDFHAIPTDFGVATWYTFQPPFTEGEDFSLNSLKRIKIVLT